MLCVSNQIEYYRRINKTTKYIVPTSTRLKLIETLPALAPPIPKSQSRTCQDFMSPSNYLPDRRDHIAGCVA